MKVLCISKWAKAPSPEERDAILPKEVPATLKLNAESVDAAKTHVHGLPLGQAGLMDFDFIPVGPPTCATGARWRATEGSPGRPTRVERNAARRGLPDRAMLECAEA
jgi:hypothetical protein